MYLPTHPPRPPHPPPPRPSVVCPVALNHHSLRTLSSPQVGAAFSNRFWLVYLLVPLYALGKFGEYVVVPWARLTFWGGGASAAGGRESAAEEAARKKMERTEKRAQKRTQKWN